ncbi:unnamed protein product [Penicillium egyptiacum]|uniref:Xylanolytic transcriptional activator regulatory domain-containing protein n=1 Tax=Penicillium egyptiacum TaxID=1303716 RepID=A0A9W4KHZ0_9EURO|nr:unnamed protein product [Penicillium egyptiacum]
MDLKTYPLVGMRATRLSGLGRLLGRYSFRILLITSSFCRFFETSDLRERARVWAYHSKRLFDSRTEAVSLAAIQACVLLCTIAFGEGDMEMESLYGAQAIRMVQLKGLPVALSSSAIQRETEIRVWWTVWMLDNWASAGARIPRQLTVDPNFPAPMEERDFENLGHEGPALTMTTPSDTAEAGLHRYGLWAQMIPLTEVIAPINEIHELTVQNRLTDDQLFERVDQISYKLDSWKLNLPSSLHFTPEARKSYAATGHGRILAALHTGFHHFSQLLYYQFLQGSISNTAGNNPKIDEYARRCRQHAAELSDLLWIAKQTPGCECSWPMVGHLLAISSSVHLHSLLFDDNESNLGNAKHMLKQNFEMMIFLRQYWPSIDLSMSRLWTFHQACQQSMNTTFTMDHWMLQFLQRYTKPVGDRDASIFSDIGNPADSCSALPWTMVNHRDSNFSYDDSQQDQSDPSIGWRFLKSFI